MFYKSILHKGIFSFFKVCLFLNGGLIQWIEDQRVPFSVKGSEWVGFDNLRSFEIKVHSWSFNIMIPLC